MSRRIKGHPPICFWYCLHLFVVDKILFCDRNFTKVALRACEKLWSATDIVLFHGKRSRMKYERGSLRLEFKLVSCITKSLQYPFPNSCVFTLFPTYIYAIQGCCLIRPTLRGPLAEIAVTVILLLDTPPHYKIPHLWDTGCQYSAQ